MSEVGAATGIEGQPSNATTTVFPVLAVVAAAVLALAALLVLWFGRGWNVRSKYDAAKAAPAPARTSRWTRSTAGTASAAAKTPRNRVRAASDPSAGRAAFASTVK